MEILTLALLRATHYGMATAALAPAPAVNSTTIHGSVSSYQSQQQTQDIEIRIMGYVGKGFSLDEEDTPVQFIEVYVQ